MPNKFELIPSGFGVYSFNWGTAVRREKDGKFITLFLYPDAQKIDVEYLPVMLTDDAIIFTTKSKMVH